MIFDREHDYYQLASVGWHRQKRIRGCVLHFEPGKMMAQRIADEFGVPKHDIVLAYRAPYNRQFTECAVG